MHKISCIKVIIISVFIINQGFEEFFSRNTVLIIGETKLI